MDSALVAVIETGLELSGTSSISVAGKSELTTMEVNFRQHNYLVFYP